ncbi:endoprotease endo-Pro [Annulohypoxylon truncatum]|uniref:endoprotease endo-Pro n=1 Tax=Annulohypoxylon truncatum TaxID=327061 RepID=UPI0020083809|nr:endoprotease endo-Pro [Annulohypoxylon truncatum]KAI1204686.1 endoprotease endo-Pro [Annulohypoxylon truncatum]
MRGSVIGGVFPLFFSQAVHGLGVPAPYAQPREASEEILAALADPEQPETGMAFFEQYIDHQNPKLGTFNQTYWYNATSWKGPGSPVVLITPGETAATGYELFLTPQVISGLIAQQVGGAVVLIEHRYWGNSTPYEAQTTKNLQYLTMDQSIADFVHFARTVKLPFDVNGTGISNASKAPWIWSGCSYPGALGAWTESIAPGTFWATHSTSGPVEAIYDFWQYFHGIQQGMPKNCSKDYSAIIDHVDRVLTLGSPKEKTNLKHLFGLQDLSHNDDVGAAISSPIGNWQGLDFSSGYSPFYQMCDAIEGFFPNSTNSTRPSNSTSSCGVGLRKALPNYARWFKSKFLPGRCTGLGSGTAWPNDLDVGCFDTHNASSPMYTDLSQANPFDRTWQWMTCNDPFSWWQTGAPTNRPTLFSRLADPKYFQRQCALSFPREGNHTFGSAQGKTAAEVNAETKGWKLPEYLDAESRVLFVNGEFDPWRAASVASESRPGGPLASSPDVPSLIVPDGHHCNDLFTADALINPGVKKVQEEIVARMVKWTGEFYDRANTSSRRRYLPPRGLRTAL